MGERIDHEAKVEERKSKRGKLRGGGEEAGAEEKEKGDGQGRERENEGEREYRERRRTSKRRRRWWIVEVVRRLPLNKCDRVRSSC